MLHKSEAIFFAKKIDNFQITRTREIRKNNIKYLFRIKFEFRNMTDFFNKLEDLKKEVREFQDLLTQKYLLINSLNEESKIKTENNHKQKIFFTLKKLPKNILI